MASGNRDLPDLVELLLALFFVLLFLNDGVDDGGNGQVEDIVDRSVGVGEVNRLVEAHLHRTDGFANTHFEEHLASGICRREAREDERVDGLALDLVERILRIAKILVESHVHLHFTIENVIRILFVDRLHSFADLVHGATSSFLVERRSGQRRA